MNTNKRPQKSKRTREHQARVLDLRSSNAASPHKPKTDYRRKPKHVGRGWDE